MLENAYWSRLVGLDDFRLTKFMLTNRHENDRKWCERVKGILVELDLEEMYNAECNVG